MIIQFFRRRESAFVLALFAVLTLIATRNIIFELDTIILGDDNDAYISVWANWWTAQALANSDTSFWQTEMIFAPVGADLTFHSFSHLNTAVTLALRPFLGALAAHNSTILFNYVLAGLSMFHLAKYETKSTTAGILAGIVFAFNSQNLYQSTHPNFISVWCFPWTTLFYLRAIRENNLKLAVWAAFFVFLGAATSTVLIFLMIFWLALLSIYMLASRKLQRSSLKIIFAFAGLCGIFIFPLVWPLLRSAISANEATYITNPNSSINTDIFSVFVPHWYSWLNRSMYLGIMPFYLAMVAFGHQRKAAKLWFILIITAFLFAIGPIPVIAGYSLQITLPWTLPVAAVLRQMYRMMVLFTMGWSMVIAFGWVGFKQQLKTSPRIQILIFIVVGLAIFIDFTAVPFPHRQGTVSTFYTSFLDDVPDEVVIATLPTGRQEDKRYMYYQTFHQHPIINGMVARGNDEMHQFIEENPLLRSAAVDLDPVELPESPDFAIQQLIENQVGYLIIDKNLIEDEDLWRDYLPLELVFEDEYLLAYSTGLVDE